MQVLRAVDLFKNIKNIDNAEFEQSKDIEIDFSNIRSINLEAVNVLLNMQKVAVLNNKNLSLSNVCPKVRQMLDVTGLGRNFSNGMTNPL